MNSISNLFLRLRYVVVKRLIGNMSVIANCTIYDDVYEYNFTVDGKGSVPHMCYNNKLKRISSVIGHTDVYTGNSSKVMRSGNSFSLQLN